eukprot:scaffold19651_cov94-Skeletonema_dohrnii-CCMP3373.AAC.1
MSPLVIRAPSYPLPRTMILTKSNSEADKIKYSGEVSFPLADSWLAKANDEGRCISHATTSR